MADIVQPPSFLIITPVYNDWDCLDILWRELKREMNGIQMPFTLLVVNDGSKEDPPMDLFDFSGEKMPNAADGEVLVLNLQRNLGHQKAIATGLAYVNEVLKPDYVIVMDSDGEDKPADVVRLIHHIDKNQEVIIFAERKKRQESGTFKFLYWWYKLIFKLLSGYIITFGNFVLIPANKLAQLVYISEIWNHFPGGIIRSKLPYTSIPMDRGKRYKGNSKMSTIGLIQHGISSITVSIDIVSVRLLIFTFSLIIVTAILLISLFYVRFFTNFAIPGWTSSIAISLLMIMLQAFFFSLLLTFMVLNARVQRTFIPAKHYKDYLRNVKTGRLHDTD